jgi:hypothetical protein
MHSMIFMNLVWETLIFAMGLIILFISVCRIVMELALTLLFGSSRTINTMAVILTIAWFKFKL